MFVSPPFSSNLKHSRSWSAISPQGPLLRGSRGLSSVEEIGEWADKEVKRPAHASLEHLNFYRRTRPIRDSRELSSPKKTGETFPKAKEQHHSPKKAESQAQDEALSRKRLSQKQANTQSTTPRKTTQAGRQVASTLQRTEQQQGPQRRLKESSSRESLDHEKKSNKGGTLEIRRHTQGTEVDGRGDRTRSAREPESFQRRVAVDARHHGNPPHAASQKERGTGKEVKDTRQRDANGKSRSTETINKRESLLLPFKEKLTRKGSVSPKGTEQTNASSKEASVREDFVASTNSLPGTLQNLKGPLSPGPWKVPSSAKILSEAEVLRDPL